MADDSAVPAEGRTPEEKNVFAEKIADGARHIELADIATEKLRATDPNAPAVTPDEIAAYEAEHGKINHVRESDVLGSAKRESLGFRSTDIIDSGKSEPLGFRSTDILGFSASAPAPAAQIPQSDTAPPQNVINVAQPPQTSSPSWLDSVYSGIKSTGNALVNTGKGLGEGLHNAVMVDAPNMYAGAKGIYRDLTGDHDHADLRAEIEANNSRAWGVPNDPQQFGRDVGRAIGHLVPAVAIGSPAGPTGVAGVMGLETGTESYAGSELMKNKVTGEYMPPSTKASYAMAHSGVAVIQNVIPQALLFKAVKMGVPVGALGKFVVANGGSAVTGSIIDNAINEYMFPDYTDKITIGQYLDAAKYAGEVGLATGVTVGGLSAAAGHLGVKPGVLSSAQYNKLVRDKNSAQNGMNIADENLIGTDHPLPPVAPEGPAPLDPKLPAPDPNNPSPEPPSAPPPAGPQLPKNPPLSKTKPQPKPSTDLQEKLQTVVGEIPEDKIVVSEGNLSDTVKTFVKSHNKDLPPERQISVVADNPQTATKAVPTNEGSNVPVKEAEDVGIQKPMPTKTAAAESLPTVTEPVGRENSEPAKTGDENAVSAGKTTQQKEAEPSATPNEKVGAIRGKSENNTVVGQVGDSDRKEQTAPPDGVATGVSELSEPVAKIEYTKGDEEKSVEFQTKVVSLDDVKTSHDLKGNPTPGYPQTIQPRDRSTMESKNQVADIAKTLNPEKLTEENKIGSGAPFINKDGFVESGNGRTMAIQTAAKYFPEKYAEYVKHLNDKGYDTRGIKNPVLVRVRTDAPKRKDSVQFSKDANEIPPEDQTHVPDSQGADNENTGNQPIQEVSRNDAGSLEEISSGEIRGTGEKRVSRKGTGIGGGENDQGIRLPDRTRSQNGRSVADGSGNVDASPGGKPTGSANVKEEDYNVGGGKKTKANRNIRAIELARQLTREGRRATPEETSELAKYTGWGGLKNAIGEKNPDGEYTFPKGWEDVGNRVTELFKDDDVGFHALKQSTLDAFYTSPSVVKEMWKALGDMNFTGGNILEPSIGSGIFFGLMPDNIRKNSNLTGVELDHSTAEIVRHLYPDADIKSGGFEDHHFSDGQFDVIIGNPPFGNTSMTDNMRKHLKGLSIHNYFIAKSVDLLKPNGVGVFVVTNGFLDGASPKSQRARDMIGDKAELLGAVRLPNNTFSDTSVTTDIVFFRKLKADETASTDWTMTGDFEGTDGSHTYISEYFVKHPENMIGDWGMFGNMYGGESGGLRPDKNRPTQTELPKIIAGFTKPVFLTGKTTKVFVDKIKRETAQSAKTNGFYKQDGVLYQKNADGSSTELGTLDASVGKKSPAKQRDVQRQIGMTDLKDTLKNLVAAQMSDAAPLEHVETLRKALNNQYDDFVAKHGLVNSRENRRAFAADPDSHLVFALEKDVSKDKAAPVTAKKSDILTKRTFAPYEYTQRADNATDALVASMTDKGKVDIVYMSTLSGKENAELLTELGDLVFEDPEGGFIPKDLYLAGNVRDKAKAAKAKMEELASFDPEKAAVFKKNYEKLKEVFPETVETYDMNVKFGSAWIPPKIMADFLSRLYDVRVKATYTELTDSWKFTVDRTGPGISYAKQSEYGTSRLSPIEIAVGLSKQIAPVIREKATGPSGEEIQVVNPEETANAREKYNYLAAAWADTWPEVYGKELTALYNEKFNAIVPAKYDGSHLKFYGKVPDSVIDLNEHQKNGVYRIMNSRATLLDHVVGAGKTFTTVAAVMEMKRTGIVQKPMIVVPNHLTRQWEKDFTTLYPDANVLTADSEDFADASKRRAFLAKIATSDFDAVIIPHSTFSKISVSPPYQQRFIQQEIDEHRKVLEEEYALNGKERNNRAIRQIENAIKNKEQQIKDLADQTGKDDIVYFDHAGFDCLVIDESQEFKNLQYSTRLQGKGFGNKNGSKKAFDLLMKARYLQTNPRSKLVFLTGTPLSNSISEAYTLQKYLQPEEMKAAGIGHFDAWVRNFAEVTTGFEIAVSGKYKINDRLANFVNLPELQRFYSYLSDTVTLKDIKAQFAAQGKDFDVPKVKGGKPNNIVVPASDTVMRVMEEIAKRAENIPRPPKPGDDNMLSLATMARKLAIDPRVYDPSLPGGEDSKLTKARDEILRVYQQWTPDKGTQLVFLDLSVPGSVAKGGKEKAKIVKLLDDVQNGNEAAAAKAQKSLDDIGEDEVSAILDAEKFSAYDWLKSELVRVGIPEGEIRFIHDYSDKAKKDALFRAVNDGDVRVLFGSSQKMGAGTNVQQRLVALHHLDAPWRPSDLEQREGRIIRRGNVLYKKYGKGFEVEILRYATERSLDAFMWQVLEFKSTAFEQFRQGDISIREITLKDAESMNAQEIKALASGNPKILQQIELQRKVVELKSAERGFKKQQFTLRGKIGDLRETLDGLKQSIDGRVSDGKLAKALPEKIVFKSVKTGKDYEKNGDITKDIQSALKNFSDDIPPAFAEIGDGFKLAVQRTGMNVLVRTKNGTAATISIGDGLDKGKEAGLATRIINAVKRLPEQAEEAYTQIKSLEKNIPALEKQIIPDFPKREELRNTVNNLDMVEQELHREAVTEVSVQKEVGGGSVSKRETVRENTPQPTGSPRKTSYKRTVLNASPMPNYIPAYIDTAYPPRPDNGKLTVGNRTVTLPAVYDDDSKADETPIRAADIRKAFEDFMGKRVFFSKLKGKVVGSYKAKTGVLGIQKHNDVETLAHEFAHWLEQYYINGTKFKQFYYEKPVKKKKDKEDDEENYDLVDEMFGRDEDYEEDDEEDQEALGDFYKGTNYKQEIWDLSYTDNPKNLQSEGFAEFVRLWFTRLDDLKAVAPNAVAAWENLIRRDNRFAIGLFDLQQKTHAYLNQGAEVLLASKQGETDRKFYQRWWDKVKNRPLERLKASVWEEYHGAKVMERELYGKIAMGDESPIKQYINSRGAAGNFEQVIEHNTVVWDPITKDFIPTGEGLETVLKAVTSLGEKVFAKWQSYSVARRSGLDLMPQGREKLLNEQEIQAGLDLANKYPEFEPTFQAFQGFNKRMLQFYVSMGLITQEDMDSYIKFNPNYVPFFRVDETGLLSEVEGGGAIIGKRLYGGTQNIKNIAQNITESLFGNIRAAFKARAKAKLFDKIEGSENGAFWARKLPRDSHLIALAESQKTMALAQFLCDTDPTTFGQFDPQNIPSEVTDYLKNNPEFLNYYQLVKPKTTGTLVDEVIRNGVREYWEVKEQILVDLLTTRQQFNDDSLMQSLKKFFHFNKVAATQAVTTTPAFGLANAIKDYPVAWIWSQYSHIPFVSLGRGLMSVIKKDRTYRDFMLHGGGGSNIGGKTISLRSSYDILGVKSKNPLIVLGRLWVKYIVSLSEKSELINRLPEFEAIAAKTGNKTEAAYRARTLTVDFAATGSAGWRKDAGAIIPFFGASLNAVNRLYEGLLEKDGKITPKALFDRDRAKIYAKCLVFATAVASTIAVNMNDPKYRELSVYEKSLFIHLYRVGDNWVKLPVEGLPKMVNSLVQSGYSGMVEQDGKFAGSMALAALSELNPFHITGLPATIWEVQTNHAWYDAPIVSEYKAKAAPEKQVKTNTTLFAKTTEKVVKAVTFGRVDPSPIEIDYVIKSMGGNWGGSILGLVDRLSWDTDTYGDQPFPYDVIGSLTYKREMSRVDNEHTRTSVDYYDLNRETAMIAAGMSSDKSIAKPTAGQKIGEARKQAEATFKADEQNQRYLAAHSLFTKVDKEIKTIRDDISDITFTKDLTRAKKEELITAKYEDILRLQKRSIEQNTLIIAGKQGYKEAAHIIGVSEKGKHPLKLIVDREN